MLLGIEIGGTKLQLGVGDGVSGKLAALERAKVVPAEGAQGILQQIRRLAVPLIAKHYVQAIGIGFGGPVDSDRGIILKSHHVAGWDGFPLVQWCRETLGLPAALANDSDMAGLGEARCGAGRGKRVVFYSNVGTGIGGAFVVDGRVYVGGQGVASELGHLRPGVRAARPENTVEAAAGGWAIAAAARANLSLAAKLAQKFTLPPEEITAKMLAEVAASGDPAARRIFRRAVRFYAWAIAQMITLLAPERVVIGGGVPLAGEKLFFAPLRRDIQRYVFPPLKDAFDLVPAELGEEVVLHGALALAHTLFAGGRLADLFFPR